MNDWVKVVVTRDSVCAGDDCDCPHEKMFKLYPDENISKLIIKIKETRYLPTIQGGKATWFLYIDQEPICLITQENDNSIFLPNKDTPIEEISINGVLNIEIKYFAQQKPDLVFQKLLSGIKPNGWNEFA